MAGVAVSRFWPATLVVSASLLVVHHVFVPTGPVGDTTYLVAVGGAAVVAWIGALRRPRGSTFTPRLIAAGLTASAVADLVWLIYAWNGYEPEVSWADAPYFLSYLLLGAALVTVTLVRARGGIRIDPDSVIDALTIVVVSVLLFWNLSIAEIVADTTVSTTTRVVWAVYPVLDAILLALVARALINRQSRSSVGLSFAGGLACWTAADTAYMLSASGQVSAVLDSGWMAGAMLMCASAFRRPAVVEESLTGAVSSHPLWRLGIATVPILFPLGLHFIEEYSRRRGALHGDDGRGDVVVGVEFFAECVVVAVGVAGSC